MTSNDDEVLQNFFYDISMAILINVDWTAKMYYSTSEC